MRFDQRLQVFGRNRVPVAATHVQITLSVVVFRSGTKSTLTGLPLSARALPTTTILVPVQSRLSTTPLGRVLKITEPALGIVPKELMNSVTCILGAVAANTSSDARARTV